MPKLRFFEIYAVNVGVPKTSDDIWLKYCVYWQMSGLNVRKVQLGWTVPETFNFKTNIKINDYDVVYENYIIQIWLNMHSTKI